MSDVPTQPDRRPRPIPSDAEREALRQLIRSVSLKRGRFTLASGAISDYYLDLRLTTTHPLGARLSSCFLLHEAARLGADRIGGPTMGADPLVGAAVALCGREDLRGFLVRSAAKDHGTARLIEGHLGPGDQALVLDDVVTAGGSILRAVEAVRSAGARVVGTFCLVDRGQGGGEKLRQAGAPLSSVFQVEEVLSDTPVSTAPAPWSSWPQTPALTVDAIMELLPGHVLLVARKNPPLGWALPGGFVELHESLDEAVRREVREETGLVIDNLVQWHTYSGPDRDPRLPTASVVFLGAAVGEPRAGDDAARVRLFPLDGLPADLCFDHRTILEDFSRGRFGRGLGPLF